jgi:hypothetical protein
MDRVVRTVIWSVLLMMALPVAAERPISFEATTPSAPLRSVVDEHGCWHVEIATPGGSTFLLVDSTTLEPLGQERPVALAEPTRVESWFRRGPPAPSASPMWPLPGGGRLIRAESSGLYMAFEAGGRLRWSQSALALDVRRDASYLLTRRGQGQAGFEVCEADRSGDPIECSDLDFGSSMDMRVMAAPASDDGGVVVSRVREGNFPFNHYSEAVPLRVARIGGRGERRWTRDIAMAPGFGGAFASGWQQDRLLVFYSSNDRYRLWSAREGDGTVLLDRPLRTARSGLAPRRVLVDTFGVALLWSTATTSSPNRRDWILQHLDLDGRLEFEVPIAGFIEPTVERTSDGGTLIHEPAGRTLERRDAIGRLLWRKQVALEEQIRSVAIDRDRLLVALTSERHPGDTMLRQYTLAGGHLQRERTVREWWALPTAISPAQAIGQDLWMVIDLGFGAMREQRLLRVSPDGRQRQRMLDPKWAYSVHPVDGGSGSTALMIRSSWPNEPEAFLVDSDGQIISPIPELSSWREWDATTLVDGRIQLLLERSDRVLERQRWSADGRLLERRAVSRRLDAKIRAIQQFPDGSAVMALGGSLAMPIYRLDAEGILRVSDTLPLAGSYWQESSYRSRDGAVPGLYLWTALYLSCFTCIPPPPDNFITRIWIDRSGRARWTRTSGDGLGDLLPTRNGYLSIRSYGYWRPYVPTLHPVDLDSGEAGEALALPVLPGSQWAFGSLGSRDLLVVQQERDRRKRLFRIDATTLEAAELPLDLSEDVSDVQIIPTRDSSWLLACNRRQYSTACWVRHYAAE